MALIPGRDAYAVELQRHGLESLEREVRWLSGLIAAERSGTPQLGTTAEQTMTTDDTATRRRASWVQYE